MAGGERGDGPEQRPEAAREQHETEHEQEMVEPGGDVERAEPQVVVERGERRHALGHHERRCAAVQHRLDPAPVAQGDPQQRGRAALGEPAHAEARADDPARAARGPAHGDALVVGIDARVLDRLTRRGQLGFDLGAGRLLARDLESHRERAVGRLLDREQRRRERMRHGGRRSERERERCREAARHRPGMLCAPTPSAHA